MPEQAPAAPVAAPAAPAAPKSATEYLQRTDDELEQVLQRPGAAAAARRGAMNPTQEAPPPAVELEKPAAEPAIAEPVADAQPEAPPEAAADAKAPEVEPVKAEPPPLTKFAVKDAEGELEVPRDLRFDFTANGREYTDVPLDKVVKMAQMGYYNEDREQQVLAAKKFVGESQQQQQLYQQQLAEYERQVDRLLTDEAFRTRAMELYQQQNSPEQRAQRAEYRVQEMQQQTEAQQIFQRAAAFTSQELSPRVAKLIEMHPNISEQEVIGQFTMLTAPLLQQGRVPEAAFPHVIRLIDGELAQWVEAKHEERETGRKTKDAEAIKAAAEMAKAKRSLARRTAPPVASMPAVPPKRTFITANDWLKAALPMAEE